MKIHVYTQTIIIILLANRKHGGNVVKLKSGSKAGHASRTRSSLLKGGEGEERERGGKRSGGGGGGRFVQAIFCFSLPTALAEYSRAILGPNVN